MAAEAFSPSFGILGIGGLVASMLGGAILIDTDVPQFQINWPAIASVAIASLALTVVIARLALVSRRRKNVSDRAEMIGRAEERRVGEEVVRTGKSRGAQEHKKK